MGRTQSIAAATEIPASRETVFAFLARLENHASLGRGSVQLLSLKRAAGATSEALVLLRGPLGIRRTASTAIVGTRMPESIWGRARIGLRTEAFVSWSIETAPRGSAVGLRAVVETADPLDRALLRLGGRWWLRRRFTRALRCLSRQLAPGRACAGAGAPQAAAVAAT